MPRMSHTYNTMSALYNHLHRTSRNTGTQHTSSSFAAFCSLIFDSAALLWNLMDRASHLPPLSSPRQNGEFFKRYGVHRCVMHVMAINGAALKNHTTLIGHLNNRQALFVSNIPRTLLTQSLSHSATQSHTISLTCAMVSINISHAKSRISTTLQYYVYRGIDKSKWPVRP